MNVSPAIPCNDIIACCIIWMFYLFVSRMFVAENVFFFILKKEIENFKLNKPGHNLSRRQTGKFLEFNFG